MLQNDLENFRKTDSQPNLQTFGKELCGESLGIYIVPETPWVP